MYIIVGLGNPTRQYAGTRHNIGFEVIDALSQQYNIDISEKKYKGYYGKGIIEGNKVILLKPQTYMNLSGESVIEYVNFFKVSQEDELIVIYDDISLEPGNIRIRKKGSAGGHNGIKNIIAHLGSQEFLRIKVGVGEKPKGWDLADFVLSRFPDNEKEPIKEAIERSIEAVGLLIQGEIEMAMNRYNKKQ